MMISQVNIFSLLSSQITIKENQAGLTNCMMQKWCLKTKMVSNIPSIISLKHAFVRNMLEEDDVLLHVYQI